MQNRSPKLDYLWHGISKSYKKDPPNTSSSPIFKNKHVSCNNFFHILKLLKFALLNISYDYEACPSYSPTSRRLKYSALPVPAFTLDLLVVNCVQLPRPHDVIRIEITSENKSDLHSPLMSAAGTAIFN
jgi:hypothetical protein